MPTSNDGLLLSLVVQYLSTLAIILLINYGVLYVTQPITLA